MWLTLDLHLPDMLLINSCYSAGCSLQVKNLKQTFGRQMPNILLTDVTCIYGQRSIIIKVTQKGKKGFNTRTEAAAKHIDEF